MDSALLRKYLLRGGSWAFAGKALMALLGLALSALLTRLLSPDDVGGYFLALNVVTFMSIFPRMGLENTLLRFVPEAISLDAFGRVKDVIYKVFLISAIGAIVTAGIWYAVLGRWIHAHFFRVQELLDNIDLIAIWLIFLTFKFLFDAAFRAFQDIRLSVFFGGGISTLLLIVGLTCIWVFVGKTTLRLVLLGGVVAGGVNTIIAAWSLRNKVHALPENLSTIATYKELLVYSWPLMLNTFTLFLLSQTDIWILASFASAEDVAVYGATARLVLMTSLVLGVVNTIVAPLISRLYVQNEKRRLEHILRLAATLAAIPTILLLLIFILFGRQVLSLLYGSYYSSGATILAVLSLGQAVNVFVGSCGYLLIMVGYQKIVLEIQLIATGMFFLLGIALVQSYGGIGVAIALAATTIVQQTLYAYFAKNRTGVVTLPYLSVADIVREFSSIRKKGYLS